MKEYLLIIDGSSLLTTHYFASLPKEITFAKSEEDKAKFYHKIMQTKSGIYTNAVHGFIRVLLKIIKEQKPTHLAVTWDISRDTFRRELYKDYKGTRGATPTPLKEQFILCQDLLKSLGISQFMDKRYEADDFSGSIAKKFEQNIPVKILSKDNDYLQLVSYNTRLWLMFVHADKVDDFFNRYGIDKTLFNLPDKVIELSPILVKEEFGVTPDEIVDLKALKGDNSDNIPGVKGCGETSAIPLIQEYHTIENLYDTIRDLDKKEEKELKDFWKTSLGIKRSPLSYLLKKSDDELVGEKAAILSKELGRIKCDIPLNDTTLDSLRLSISRENGIDYFNKLEFKSLINKL